MREVHRITPTWPMQTFRTLLKDIELNGYHIPKETRIYLGTSAVQHDPKYVDKPDQFNPNRWSSEEVLKRKSTEKAIIDNGILQDNFSYGPRICPGARVAKIEVKMMLIQLLRDWKIELVDPKQVSRFTHDGTTFMIPNPYPKLKFTPRK